MSNYCHNGLNNYQNESVSSFFLNTEKFHFAILKFFYFSICFQDFFHCVKKTKFFAPVRLIFSAKNLRGECKCAKMEIFISKYKKISF